MKIKIADFLSNNKNLITKPEIIQEKPILVWIILQIDKNTKSILNIYTSINEAIKKTNILYRNIYDTLKWKQKTAWWFIWEKRNIKIIDYILI